MAEKEKDTQMEPVQRRRKGWIIPLILLVILGAFLAFRFSKGAKSPASRTREIDFTQIPDGSYDGQGKTGPVRAEGTITVKAGRVSEIDLTKHITGKGKPAEAILADVIAAQSLDVDVISGATWSSNAILEAIENAWTKGVQNAK